MISLASLDLVIMREMIKFCRSVAKLAPMKEMISASLTLLLLYLHSESPIAKELNPGAAIQTDEEIEGEYFLSCQRTRIPDS